jgi:putative flippase GtrA
MSFEAAVVLADMVGIVFAFFLFQKLLFGGTGGPRSRRVIPFVQMNLLGAGLAWAVSSLMARLALPAIGWDFHPFEVAHCVGVAAPAISSSFPHKHSPFA